MSFSCSLYWEINSRVPSLLHQKPFLFSTEKRKALFVKNALFVKSENNGIIILALPAVLLLGAE